MAYQETGSGVDYSKWKTGHERDRMTAIKPETIVVQTITTSDRYPIDPQKTRKVSARRLPGNGQSWYLVDAVRASSLVPFDPGKVSPRRIGRIIDKVADYSEILAHGGNLPSGLTTLPDRSDLPTMYRFQEKGTGTENDLTAFIARDETKDPLNPDQTATVLVASGICTNSDVGKALRRTEDLGYGRREQASGKVTRR